jgi:hypothetical protein
MFIAIALPLLFAPMQYGTAPVPETTKAFEQRLIADLASGVEGPHKTIHDARLAGRKDPDNDYTGALVAMTALHGKTGDRKYLDWAKEGMLWLVETGTQPTGANRDMQAFCEAFIYLRNQKTLTAEEQRKIAAAIVKGPAAYYDYIDWGPHNRAIHRAAYYFAAAAVPDAPDVEKWKKYGDALTYDSWSKWSIEDATTYNPFWLIYLLTAAEVTGKVEEIMNAIPTRFYLEQYSRLLMPDNMMPDWGDGGLGGNWHYFVANMVRGGSYYRNGRYLDFARRLYAYFADLQKFTGVRAPDELYCAATTLRWLDTSVEMVPYEIRRSEEVVDDLVSKKIVFRNDKGPHSSFALFTYRDAGPSGRSGRDYMNQAIPAAEEKPHHGHADENSFGVLMDDQTLLLAEGGYRESYTEGWRADSFHNRVVARPGWPPKGNVLDYINMDRTYNEVRTEKVHFGTFEALDYSRTRLTDEQNGYTGDRIILFVPSSGMYVVVDSIRIDRAGNKTFANIWHPGNILRQSDNYVVSWVPDFFIGFPVLTKERWKNPHNKELLIQFVDNRDKTNEIHEIRRLYGPSKAFYQYISNYFFVGQRLTFITVLQPHAPGTFSEEKLKAVEVLPDPKRDGRTLGLRIRIDDSWATVGLKLDPLIGLTNFKGRPMFDWETGTVEYGQLATDADFSFALDRSTGVEYGLMNASRITYRGRVLFEVPTTTSPTRFDGTLTKDRMPRYHDVVRTAAAVR